MTIPNMLVEEIAHILDRDLQTLKDEVQAYPDEAGLWKTPSGLPNSAGTLAMHLVGNLRHFIGTQYADSGYIRDRHAEFNARHVPRAALLDSIDAARAEVRDALEALDDNALEQDYVMPIGGVQLQTRDWFLHLIGHFAYHLGQIDYHRRFVTGQTEGLGALSIKDLYTARKPS